MTDVAAPLDWVPHAYERRPWRQQVPRGPRSERRVREIEVALPPLIRDLDFQMPDDLARLVTASLGELSNLDLVHGRTLKALNHLHLRAEAIDSSKIEDIEAGLADYGRALLGVGANASATSMASATSALTRLIGDTDRTRSVRAEAVLQAHDDLFRRNPEEAHRAGSFRTTQNWIGGSDYSPTGALHVPPPPETVPDYLDDLFAFANRDDVSPLVQAAIVHAQFESIHPFIDGNGRIGRTLIHAVLRRRRSTRHLTVPIASALVADRDGYFAALNDYRAGRARTLVVLLASATRIATAEAWRTARDIDTVRDDWGRTVGGTRPGTPLHRVLDLLTEEPIVNERLVSDRLRIGESDASDTMRRLVEARILTAAPGSRRSPVWLADDILAAVQRMTERVQENSRRWATPHT
ncbi:MULTISPECIES: Fic family protein [Nocardioides]|uniref:Fic family protein n=1 Tax=Nocardioides vastitatis TaxID=2568655 RepID=A0ABW0ZGY6_9ACTN|nr:Fic family protein [Nocardioides sp.]THI99689.1 Fic family protein [Nocardioides sp.]